MIQIIDGDLSDPRVTAMVQLHLAGLHASTPTEHVFALDTSGLKGPAISFYTAWINDNLAGMGAIKALDATSGELKSMRTDMGR